MPNTSQAQRIQRDIMTLNRARLILRRHQDTVGRNHTDAIERDAASTTSTTLWIMAGKLQRRRDAIEVSHV